jgi:superfamily II DNA helicase RecQ
MELTHFVTVLDANTPRMPRVMWNDSVGEAMSFDGHPIRTSAFRNMYQKLEKNTRALLFNDVLFGLELPDLHHGHVHDELNNKDLGYSFISDTRNTYHHHGHFLGHAMMDADKFGDRFFFTDHTNDVGGIAWNKPNVEAWLRTCELCIGNLFALIHYGGGQPARGTELAILGLENRKLLRRNIYWYSGYVNLVTMYNKTQTNSSKPRLIGRSLPPSVGKLMILWLALVVPTLNMIWRCYRRDPVDPDRFLCRLFTGLSGDFNTEDFSAILSSISGEAVGDHGLGLAMGIADTRHFLIAIMRKFCLGIPDRHLFEEYFNEQSGHGEDAAENYAISYDSILNVSHDRLEKFVEISKLQHRCLYPTEASAPPIVSNPSLGTTLQTAAVDYKELASAVNDDLLARFTSASHMAPLASHMATYLAPAMKRNIADGFAAIVPIIPREVVQPIGPSNATPAAELPGFVAWDLTAVDISQVQIHPARRRELRQLFGPHATFKSQYQACALELSAQREKDLLVILGTAGGKSLLFMACAVNANESNLATVVVVPLISLLKELVSRLRASGIRVMEWSTNITHHGAQVVLVLADAAATKAFQDYFLNGCEQGRIARLVFDEIHFVVTSSHYRPIFNDLKHLRQGRVPFVGLSATVPPDAVKKIAEKMHFLPGNTLVIRAPTKRKEIVYSVFEMTSTPGINATAAMYRAADGTEHKVIEYITQFLTTFQPKDRALIFCLTKCDTEDIAAALGCRYYHSEVENKADVLRSWREGEMKVLAATTALGSGIDYDEVKLVVNYGKPRNIIDFSQESGRGGRNLPIAYSTVFWNPRAAPERLLPDQDEIGIAGMSQYVKTKRCRRLCLKRNLDGGTETAMCIQDCIVALCDCCEVEVENTAVVSLWSNAMLTACTDFDQHPLKDGSRQAAIQAVFSEFSPERRSEVRFC